MKQLINKNKIFKKEKVTTVLFLIVIFVMFIGMIISWQEIRDDFLNDYRTTVAPKTPIIQRVIGAIDSFERTISCDTYKRENFIELYGLTQKIMKRNIIADAGYGELYKTSYNQIAFSVGKKDVASELESICKLKYELDQEGIPLLYIQAPFKLQEGNEQLPQNVKDYANDNADRFLDGLDKAGIDYLDLRPSFWSSGMNQNQLFYNTDHHWTIDGAFYSFGDIVSKLNKEYHFNINDKYTDINNYKRKTYREFYIGSMGRRVGKAYGGVDDFSLITPNFDTSYTIYEREYGGEKIYEGTFEKAVLTNSYMNKNASLDTNRYAVYHGDNAELEFINHNVKEGKILMVKDSFGLPIYSFLSLGVNEVRALDVRLYKESVSSYAKEHKPDVVLILYNADCFGSSMFNFEAK